MITAAHVLPNPKPSEGYRITAYIGDHQSQAELARPVDATHDLALLFVPGDHIPPIRLATSAPFGTRIGALGYGDIDRSFFPSDLSTELLEGTIAQPTGSGFVNYDITTSQGFSGGPVFDLRTGSLVGIVHGTTSQGTGGYEGVDVTQIRRFLQSDPPDPPPPAVAAVARVTKSLALLDCPKSALTPPHLTGVIVASDSLRSYVATAELYGCQPTVHIAGNKRTAYQGREVPVDGIALADKLAQPPQVDLVEIDAPNLAPIALNAPSISTHAYVLSFAESTIAQHTAVNVVPPRVDETDVSAGSNSFDANDGISAGASVFDAAYAHFLGIVSSINKMPTPFPEINKYGGLETATPGPPRTVYDLVSPSEITRRMEFSVDNVPYQHDALPEHFPEGSFAVLQQGRFAGSASDYDGFATAVALGSRNGHSYFVTSLGPNDRDRLVLDVSDRHGATQKVDATVAAYDPSTTLAILSTQLVPLSPPHWGALPRAGAAVLAVYYGFCSWQPSRAAELGIRHYVPPACRAQVSRGYAQDFFHNGTLSVSSLRGVLGRSFQGSPVLDAATLQVEGLIAPDIFASIITGNRIVSFLRANGWTVEAQ
ncbi:MAG: trypsin-like peptidase domain-containing protein [Candidatus Eremiobacteraeota bacterium]|nr:trypsin-like peptidase domain-containing protein [Candidatus Eremiobacteraeota bacterium]